MNENSYVVVVPNSRKDEYVSFGLHFNLTKRAAGQIKRGLAKIDKRYAHARTIMVKTARKESLI